MNIKKFNYRLILLGILTGFINGLFGSGGGTIIVPALVFIIGLEEHKAHATAISIILPLSIVSSFMYFKNIDINLRVTFFVIIGSVIGGLIGAKLLNKVPNKLLRKLFGIFMIIAAIRLVMR